VPEHLKTKTRKKIAEKNGAGDDKLTYRYAIDYEGGFVPQAYLPEGRVYYTPTENGQEKRIKERLEYWRQLRIEP